MNRFASEADFAVCEELHRKHGTTYYFATRFFPPTERKRVHAVYGFVRVPDEFVDNPTSGEDARLKIGAFREEFLGGLAGQIPTQPVLRAFCDVVHESGMDVSEATCFLDAMEADLTVTRYANYDELRDYMRGSAAAVGLMMCDVIGVRRTPSITNGAVALGEAMQLTNFLRDVGEDLVRGRVYLPQDEMARFGISDETLRTGVVTPEFRALMRFQIERARKLYAEADTQIPALPTFARKPVRVARVLYSRILDRIEARNYDVFSGRARTSRVEKLIAAGRVMLTAP
jgi:15-cis-phytoene synthase